VHRGALAAMHRPALAPVASLLAGARRVAVLEDIVDHTNVGAAFRSAAALGVDAVLVTPRCADPLYRRSVRVSMGTVFQVPWTRIDPWPDGISALREAGFVTAALALSDDSITLDELVAARPERLALVLGAEGHGLKPLTVAESDLMGPVLTRSAIFDFFHQDVRQDEVFYLARIDDPGEVDRSGWTDIEREFMDEVRWWAAGELAEVDIEVFPHELPQIVAELATGWDGTVRHLGRQDDDASGEAVPT